MIVTSSMMETRSGIFIDLANPKPENINIQDIAWALSRLARFTGHSSCDIPYTVGQHSIMVANHIEEALTKDTHLNEVFNRYLQSNFLDAVKIAENQELIQNDSYLLDMLDYFNHVKPDEIHSFVFHGLMHDFAEAYLTDLPTPVKRLPGIYESYKAAELKMDDLIFEKFNLVYSKDKFPEEWKFSQAIVGWADMYALQLEAYHFVPSRGLNWGIQLERPSLQKIEEFKQPMPPVEVREQLLSKFTKLHLKNQKRD